MPGNHADTGKGVAIKKLLIIYTHEILNKQRRKILHS
jgi:hypothetical protein